MDATTFVWALVATAFAGSQLFVQKIIAQERRDSAFSGVMMYGVSGVIALAIFLYQGTVPEEWQVIAFVCLAAGAVHGVGNFVRLEALKYIDSVIYFPINKVLGPVLVVIGAVFLFGEALSTQQYIGIGLSLMVPLLLIGAGEHTRQNNLRGGLIYVVVSTALTSINVILTKEALLLTSDIMFIVVMSQIAGVVFSGILMLKQRRTIGHLGPRDVLLGFLLGVLGLASYYTLLVAFSTGLLSIVYVIHAHYILIPIVLSVWWYKEHINLRKAVAVVVSCLAITVLYE